MRVRSAFSWAGTICGVAAVVAAWFTLWPIGLGGSTGYAIVIGTSMEPHIHRGDLAIVQRSSDYRVGEVVAYHSRTLGRTVLHRIIAVHNGSYVFRGDANNFTDPGLVRRSDLIGRYWFKIGGAAPVLQWVQRPWHAALIAGLLGLFLFGSGAGIVTRRRRRRRRADVGGVPPPRPATAGGIVAHTWQPLAGLAGAALIAFATLGVVAHGLPPTHHTPTDRLYSQSGRFSYTAPAPVGPAYPSGRVVPGEAVFTRLVHRLDVSFDWQFDTRQPHQMHGTAALAAVVSDGDGWSRRIVLAPRQSFAGDRLELAGTLELNSLEQMLRRLETVTGARNTTYQLQIAPEIQLAGTVAGTPVTETFSPPLQLTLDQLRLAPVASTDPAQPNGLTRSKDTGGTLVEPNAIRFAGRQLALAPAKRMALVGGIASLALLLLALLARAATRPRSDAARLRARYGRWIVRVADASPTSRVVELTAFDDLARIAERYDRLILQDEGSGACVVEEEGVTYRWRPAATASSDALARIADVVEQRSEQAPAAERRNLRSRPWARRNEASAGEDDSATAEL